VLLSHITCRGNRGQTIFFDDRDRHTFFKHLASAVERFEWRCHAYCLLTNHFHLLLETSDPARLARGMLVLNGAYARYVNWRNELTGHLFQGPYHHEPVERDSHLLELCRYIVRNPVRAGLVARPGDWPWSSYRATGALMSPPPFLQVAFVRGLFGSPAGYREFCNQVAEQPGCNSGVCGAQLISNRKGADGV
jgi:putative transposase